MSGENDKEKPAVQRQRKKDRIKKALSEKGNTNTSSTTFKHQLERERKLDSIGFLWEAKNKDGKWERLFSQLKQYSKIYGTNGECNEIDINNIANNNSGNVGDCDGSSSTTRSGADTEEERAAAAAAAMNDGGRELSPPSSEGGPDSIQHKNLIELSNWIVNQRLQYHNKIKSMLTPSRISRLLEIGFDFNYGVRKKRTRRFILPSMTTTTTTATTTSAIANAKSFRQYHPQLQLQQQVYLRQKLSQ